MSADTQSTLDGVQERVQATASGIVQSVQDSASKIASQGQTFLDRTISPQQRTAMWEKLQDFMQANPKLSIFLGINLLLTGVPLGLFSLFTITVTLSSAVIGLLLGLLGALTVVIFAVGSALCILLPTIFFTTTCACFLFFWYMVGNYILVWAKGKADSQENPEDGASNRLKRLAGSVKQATEEKSTKSLESYGDRGEEMQTNGLINGTAEETGNHATDTTSKHKKVGGGDGGHNKELVVTSTA